MEEQYFTVKQIATHLQYQENTIRLEIKAGRLRAIQIRGQYRISAKDLAAYIKLMATKEEDEEVDLIGA